MTRMIRTDIARKMREAESKAARQKHKKQKPAPTRWRYPKIRTVQEQYELHLIACKTDSITDSTNMGPFQPHNEDWRGISKLNEFCEIHGIDPTPDIEARTRIPEPAPSSNSSTDDFEEFLDWVDKDGSTPSR
jgi:hypothetical protein